MDSFTLILYFSIILFSTLFGVGVERGNSIQERICRLLCFLTLWVPAAIRYDIGTDYPAYEEFFYDTYSDYMETGFQAIFAFVRWVNNDPRLMFAIVAFLTYLPICFFLPKERFALVMFFFTVTFYMNTYSILRQSLAVCIIAYAFYYLIQHGGKIRFAIFVLIATLFHSSAILCLLFIFIKPVKSAKTIFIIIAVALGFVLMTDIVSILFNNAFFLATRYADYASNEFSRETELGSGLGWMIRLSLPVVVLLSTPRIIKENENFTYLIAANLLYMCALILCTQVYIFGRFVFCFHFVTFLSIAMIYDYLGKYRKIIVLGLAILTLAYFYVSIFMDTTGAIGVSPYKTIFNPY